MSARLFKVQAFAHQLNITDSARHAFPNQLVYLYCLQVYTHSKKGQRWTEHNGIKHILKFSAYQRKVLLVTGFMLTLDSSNAALPDVPTALPTLK